jgi:peptidoglycan/xylan/chitin deacetylase (PgdA/CDA1 family)
MDAGKARLAAASLSLLLAASTVVARAQAWPPKPERLEVLKAWEKEGDGPPPEIVAGVYERDYERYDFENELAITIDDAAPNNYLAMELDVLKKYGAKAVFFIIGSYFVDGEGRPLARAKELLERVVGEGHAIGSHSFKHMRLDEGGFRDDRAAIGAELDRNQAVIDEILGYHYPILYFRPPNGAHSTPGYALDRELLARGQYLVNWTITAFDWNMRYKPSDPEHLAAGQVIARTLKQAREESGGVVLYHGFPTSALVFDELMGALASAGNKRGRLRFSTLDEILRLKYGSPSSAPGGR